MGLHSQNRLSQSCKRPVSITYRDPLPRPPHPLVDDQMTHTSTPLSPPRPRTVLDSRDTREFDHGERERRLGQATNDEGADLPDGLKTPLACQPACVNAVCKLCMQTSRAWPRRLASTRPLAVSATPAPTLCVRARLQWQIASDWEFVFSVERTRFQSVAFGRRGTDPATEQLCSLHRLLLDLTRIAIGKRGREEKGKAEACLRHNEDSGAFARRHLSAHLVSGLEIKRSLYYGCGDWVDGVKAKHRAAGRPL
ncbi:hypothetical protein BDK51DRAFT_42049 [Blyttiomyces helicus]|uniref:Uncharacterized protein n=1 Tax=Blyttiomyces helicus TaxID=388810 RepID=A0A4P9WK80_9FUNG|nr:hypothetical protein BDK51DRAFT_42049 [Blyttiomyces helicus]|eukprot:RKO93214.1 hypothetical protein BDK51DRAFT_42049 [Blyttiomyces helicus]